MNATLKKNAPELIKLGKSQVGIHEVGGNNDGPVIRMYQSVIGKAEKEPWCLSFLQWLVREIDKKMGTKTSLFATESTQLLFKDTPKECRLHLPEPGCILVWQKYKDETPLSIGHVALVTEVLNSDYVLTVEGNTAPGDGIQREGDGVYMKRRYVNQHTGYMRVRGFLSPWK